MDASPASHMVSMSSMIVELTRNISHPQRIELNVHQPENTFAGASYNSRYHQRASGKKWDEAHVSHEPKGAILLISIRGKCCLEKTSLRFSCYEYHMRCYG